MSGLAGPGAGFAAVAAEDVDLKLERHPGVGSTDFWGISFAHSDYDRQPMTGEELERELALLRASWAFFAETSGRVSAELRKGPRGGGRDRDRIVRQVTAAEMDMGRKLGVPADGDAIPEGAELAARRDTYVAAIRALRAEGRPARSWPLRYLIRHMAFHSLDHAWEMEDKDLSAEA